MHTDRRLTMSNIVSPIPGTSNPSIRGSRGRGRGGRGVTKVRAPKKQKLSAASAVNELLFDRVLDTADDMEFDPNTEYGYDPEEYNVIDIPPPAIDPYGQATQQEASQIFQQPPPDNVCVPYTGNIIDLRPPEDKIVHQRATDAPPNKLIVAPKMFAYMTNQYWTSPKGERKTFRTVFIEKMYTCKKTNVEKAIMINFPRADLKMMITVLTEINKQEKLIE